jgi:peptidoglycan-associated lipoprotein
VKTTNIILALSAVALPASATTAHAQLRVPRMPVIIPLGNQPPPPQAPGQAQPGMGMPGVAQANLAAAAGSDTVYFSARSTILDVQAMATLGAQARWLLANPMATVRLEGHGDLRDTRDYALAIGEKRAASVRDFLVLQGVLPHRINVTTWGKERPGSVRVGPSVVATGPRVVTIVE